MKKENIQVALTKIIDNHFFLADHRNLLKLIESEGVSPQEFFSTTDMEFNIEQTVHKEEEAVQFLIQIDIESVHNKIPKQLLGSCSVAFQFLIKDAPKVINQNDGQLPDDLLLMLLSISISSMRGILYSKFRATFLHGHLLPILGESELKGFLKNIKKFG